jgi:peptidyl-dipeptidase Dcp
MAMSEIQQITVASQAPANPLLKAWQTPFETPPFAEIAPEHFLPAFEQAFADHAAEIAAIEHDPAEPDFANTITELERAGKLLSRVAAVFYDLVAAHSNPALLEIDKEVSLRTARHWNPIMMNAVLFGRIALLHGNRAALALTAEQMRLLERTYTRFHRAGAGLDEAAKTRMAESAPAWPRRSANASTWRRVSPCSVICNAAASRRRSIGSWRRASAPSQPRCWRMENTTRWCA